MPLAIGRFQPGNDSSDNDSLLLLNASEYGDRDAEDDSTQLSPSKQANLSGSLAIEASHPIFEINDESSVAIRKTAFTVAELTQYQALRQRRKCSQ